MIIQETDRLTVGSLLAKKVHIAPNSRALLYCKQQVEYTYGELNNISCSVAQGLLALDVVHGSPAAIWATNLPEWLLIQFGCAKVGVPLVAINSNYRAYELEYVLKQSITTTLFIADGASQPGEYLTAIYEICPELKTARPGCLQSERLPALRNVVFLGQEQHPGMFTWQEFLEKSKNTSDKELAVRENAVTGEDIFVIQYTSGTTGTPKGAMFTQRSYIINALATAECQGLTSQDISCIPLPFFHAYGCIAVMAAVAVGASIAAIERFNAQELLRTIQSCQATAVCGTPTMFVATLEEMKNHTYNLSSLRGGNMAGAPCSSQLVKTVVEKMGAREFGILYGSTEAIISIMNRWDDSLEHRITTLGQAMPEVELKIINPQTGMTVATGIDGELCIKSPSQMKGYYNMPETTGQALDGEGWLHSGDLACATAEGYYHITGRIKDLIIRGGENVYPAEIEEFLYTHPKIKDAQVVGIPCEYYGEEVVAFIRLQVDQTATPLEIKRYCRERIAIHKVPAQFLFVDQYPQTASGKVQKFRLKEMAMQMLKGKKL
ncbi:MAG: acyl-CoA synthetase (AMP-forming)/AMP-acid ligase [Firmicutes bacterium]|nr:acyl-CoA synthetase (AMP-forming)/AMP-acid ligase [Bacillota bacterium]